MKPEIEIRRYGTRNWAVYEGGELLAVTVYKKGALGRLKVSLRRQQIELAKTGNPTMLIWLGKQLLEQRDKADATNQVTVKEVGPHKLTPEDEAFLKRKAELMG